MNAYLYLGDPFLKTTSRVAVKVAELGDGCVSLEAVDGFVNQQPPSGEGKRDSYGVLGRRPSADGVAAWERWKRNGALITGWTGDSYALVELP